MILQAVVPEIILFGVPLGPVAVILIGEAILFFLLMNIDFFASKMVKRAGTPYKKYFLFWVFLMFALFSAAPLIFGIDSGNLSLILGTIILFGIFIPGFGVSNVRRNLFILLTAVLGSIVGYQFARIFLVPYL